MNKSQEILPKPDFPKEPHHDNANKKYPVYYPAEEILGTYGESITTEDPALDPDEIKS